MKMKRAHPQMIFRRFLIYLIFAALVLIRRIAFDKVKPDAALIAETALSLLLLLLSFFKWLFFKYGCDGKSFVIKTGIFFKRQTVIPMKNISTLDADGEIFLGLLKGTFLRIDTEAGCYKRSDFEFPIYKRDAVEILEAAGRDYKRLYKASFWECIVSTLTLSKAHIGILLILPILSRISRLAGVRSQDAVLEGISRLKSFEIRILPAALSALFYILLIGWIINFIYLSFCYLKLRVCFDGETVKMHRGLIIKRRTVLRKEAVRAYIIRKPPILLLFRRSRVHALCAGYGKETGEVSMLVPSDTETNQKQILEKMFSHKYSGKLTLKARDGADFSQKLYYFSILSLITAAALFASLIFPENGFLYMIYLVSVFLLCVRAAVYITQIKNTGISQDLKHAVVLKGFSLCSIYFPTVLPREVKIKQNIFQKISNSCTVKIYLRSEKRRSYNLYCADYRSACKFSDGLSQISN